MCYLYGVVAHAGKFVSCVLRNISITPIPMLMHVYMELLDVYVCIYVSCVYICMDIFTRT